MKKITYYGKAVIVFSIFGLLVMFAMNILQKGVAYFKDSKDLWSYEYLLPQKKNFTVGEPITFLSKRIATADLQVNIVDKLSCDSKYIDSFTNKLNYSAGTFEWKFDLGEKVDGKFVPFLPPQEYKNCTVTSCQFVEYHGVQKTQCYETNLFDVIQRTQSTGATISAASGTLPPN